MILLTHMSGDSVFYYQINKKKEEQESVIDNPQDIATDIMKNLSRKK